jgi:nicotinate-nucleotide adenylyltransferase
MVEAAIRGVSGFEVSRADVDRPHPHYALGTIAWLRERHPGSRFVYLMGSDSLMDLPTWHRPAELLAACEAIGVVERDGKPVDWLVLEAALPGIRSRCRVFRSPPVGISARDIRSRIREGRPFRFLLAPAVAVQIERDGLYR